MKKLTLIAFAAAVLIAGAFAWEAEATTRLGTPASANSSLLEPAACWCGPYRCACGHPYYRRVITMVGRGAAGGAQAFVFAPNNRV